MTARDALHMLRDAMPCIAPRHEGEVLLRVFRRHDLTARRRAGAVLKGVHRVTGS
ncbi:hypothetical protein BMS3Bbin10_00527 [bacterium BMS3Bbin10]|nr:hypothetical protein BMS3Bbin10_00527 [bacterium BMS3Bbin10]